MSKSAVQSRLGFAVVGMVAATTWLVSHGFQGIFHDGNLYALQALARTHPALSSDVFLKLGSQDRFSIFSPVYAALINLMGLEPATATLTCLLQLAFLTAAWALARVFMPSSLALLGVGVLAAVPGTYGAHHVFTCMETFLTPRMAAEAMALAGIAAALTSRRLLATALIITAALVHPIMAAAAIVCLFILNLGIPRPRLAVAGMLGAIIVYAVLAIVMGGDIWGRFDAHWCALIAARSPYLFVTRWHLDDWAPTCVSVATLACGVVASTERRPRAFLAAVLITVLLGLTITWVGADTFHLILPTQAQAWRWTWLGTAVSALLLPLIVRSLWSSGAPGRSSTLLLLTAWVFASNLLAIVAAAGALAAIVFMGKMRPHETRHGVWGSALLLAIACLWRVASNLEFTDVHYQDFGTALWLQRNMSFAHDGSVPIAVLGLTWFLAGQRRRVTALLAVGAMAAALFIAAVPRAWAMWTASEYSRQAVARFAPMREKIPSGADVFWPEAPAAAWALLDAPSYLSVVQTSGLVFSRATAIELDRRAFALKEVTPTPSFMDWDAAAEHMNLSREQLARACATGEFNFLVSHYDLGVGSVADVATGDPPKYLHLYRCAASRS